MVHLGDLFLGQIRCWATNLAHEFLGGSEYDFELDFQVSCFLSDNTTIPPIRAVRMRSAFVDAPFVEIKPVAGHTHGQSAASRSSASSLIDSIAQAVGRDVIFYQGSAADVRNGRKISRDMRWAKDANVKPQRYSPKPQDMVALVDVDYYVDMPRFMLSNYRPILVYTFQPSVVSKSEGEYKFTFNSKDEVIYRVSGGANYQHQVWNYSGDTVVVKKKILGFIPWTHMTFSLERRQIDADHQLVLLSPLTKHTGVASWFAEKRLAGAPLRRLTVQGKEGFLRLETNDAKSLMVHTGRVGEYSCSSTNVCVDNELASVVRTSKVRLNLPMVKGKMGEGRKGSEMLLEFHLTNDSLVSKLTKSRETAVLSTVDPYVRGFQWVTKKDEYDAEAKPSVVSFMTPIVDGAFAPDMTRGNERRSIAERVEKVKDATTMTTFLGKVVREFVAQLAGDDAHCLVPYGEEELRERQNKPTQRRILDSAEYEEAKRETRSFMKRECYANVNDPRTISQINGSDKREYSAYMYALSDFLKQFDWYAFGKSNLEVADRVAAICSSAKIHVSETDFSRMDGRVGQVARDLEKAVCMRLFGLEYHDHLDDLLRSQHNLKGKTKFGIAYETLMSRLSGSPETSPFNTILNVFVAFLTFRRTMNPATQTHHTPAEAWQRLGIYGGDDGLTADANSSSYVEAAAMVGQKLTSAQKEHGVSGVKFLARQYGPDVWFGDNNSCCDFARTLSKFHTSVTMPESISPKMKLLDKAYACWLSDKNSPVLGCFVSKVVSCAPRGFSFKNLNGKWGIEEDRSKQYPNEGGDWMEGLFAEQLPLFNVGQFLEWLDNTSNLDDLLAPPSCAPPVVLELKPDAVVVIDGDIHGEEKVAGVAPKPALVERRTRSMRRNDGQDRPNRKVGSTGKPVKTKLKGSVQAHQKK
jgi:hypothetical protein